MSYAKDKKRNILVCFDSFKESISSKRLNNIVESELKVNHNVVTQVIADGGEGTVDAFLGIEGYTKRSLKVQDPLLREIYSYYAYNKAKKTAIIEMALASGIERLVENEKDTKLTTTYGTGQLIKDAIDKGAQKIIVGIGSSATTDGGIGMANALGYRFLDENGDELEPIGQNLKLISSVESDECVNLNNVKINVACDVNNTLYGLNGAAYIYGPQKGASVNDVRELDFGLKNLADILGNDKEQIQGSGAAGGLGYGLMSFCYASLENGFKLIAEELNLEIKIKKADIVITGEGKFDSQSLNGKAPFAVCQLAKKYDKKCIGIFGMISAPQFGLNSQFDAMFSTTNKLQTFEQTLEDTEPNLRLIAKSINNLA